MKKKLIILGFLSSFGITNLFAFPYGMFPDICENKNQELVYTNDKNETILEVELPGYNKENIQINYKNEYLIIDAKNNKDDKNFKIERNFYKKYIVGNLDFEKIKTEYINGILKITLPKEDNKINLGKKIEIK